MSEPVQQPADQQPQNVTAPENTAHAAPETGEDWQAKFEAMRNEMRKQEQRAKANAEAAERLAQIEEAQKSAEQKQAEALAKAQRDAQVTALQSQRLSAAFEAGVTKDFLSYVTGDTAEAIAESAQRAAKMAADHAELEQYRAAAAAAAQQPPAPKAPNNGVPTVPTLIPGATPVEVTTVEDAYPASWLPRHDSNQ